MNKATGSVILGYAPMDAIHREFDALVAKALACRDEGLLAALDEVHEHLIQHFREEDEWMRHSRFPAAGCHVEEHSKVLASAAEVLLLVAQGNVEIGRAFCAELQAWFPGHAGHLDSALAAWLCKLQHGGAPLVMHPRRRAFANGAVAGAIRH